MFKKDLTFRTSLMNSAGMLGFAPDVHMEFGLFPGGGVEDLSAFVTNPISWRPRLPVNSPTMIPYPGGLLLHTGHPNPGFSAVIKKYARRWAAARQPVILHLMVEQLGETVRMLRALEDVENIAAVELGFEPMSPNEKIFQTVTAALGELPLIMNLSFDQILSLGPQVIKLGASALSFAPPRGALLSGVEVDEESDRILSGRLYGPGLFPQSLSILRSAVRLGLPIIGGVGVYSRHETEMMMAEGALAIQLDTVLWK